MNGHRIALACVFLLSLLLVAPVCKANPHDPHVPRCSTVWKGRGSACPWFEGWYVRVVDATSGSTFAVIVGHMPATNESIAVLLACYPKPQASEAIKSADMESLSLPKQCPAPGSGDGSESGCEGEGEPQRREMVEVREGEGKLPLEVPQLCDSTLMSEIQVKRLPIISVGHPPRNLSHDPDPLTTPWFEWNLPGVGFLRTHGYTWTQVDVQIGGARLQANLTTQVPWDKRDQSAGPEGWMKTASEWLPADMLPCRYFVHTLGSATSYRFTNESDGADISSTGWSHVEKNWGSYFPHSHSWMQGTSQDNTVHFVGAVVNFKFLEGFITTPNIPVFGFRSPLIDLDIRSIDPCTTVSDIKIDACQGLFSFHAVTPTAALTVTATASPQFFSPPFFVPTNDASWESVCQQNFRATIRVDVRVRKGVVRGSEGVCAWWQPWTWDWWMSDNGSGSGDGETALFGPLHSFVIPNSVLEFSGGYRCHKE